MALRRRRAICWDSVLRRPNLGGNRLYNPTRGEICLEDAMPGDSRWARIARSRRGIEVSVSDIVYDDNGYLLNTFHHLRGDSPLAIGMNFAGQGRWQELHYHPGADALSERAAWDLLRALWSVGKFAQMVSRPQSSEELRGSTAANNRIPSDIQDILTVNGLVHSPERIVRAFNNIRNAHRFPREGYYIDDSASDLLVIGKIRATDIS